MDQISQMETACGSLLYELKIIWDEIGESDTERDKVLLELEQECLNIYRRKVDQVNQYRAQLQKEVADAEAEIVAICSVIGEPPALVQKSNQSAGSLKEELGLIIPLLEEMQRKKENRRNQFIDIMQQIQIILHEFRPTDDFSKVDIDESDLSTRKLEDLYGKLQLLEREKADRLKQVTSHLSSLNSLCLVLGIDFENLAQEGSLGQYEDEGYKNISDAAIQKLASEIQRLREVKIKRIEKLQDLVTSMLELWNLMDTPLEEQQIFQNITCNIAASEHEIVDPNALSVDFIKNIESEVMRLEKLKTSKMKDLVLKKKNELDEILMRAHMFVDADDENESRFEAVEGTTEPSLILEQLEYQISAAKEEEFSRKEILEKMEKWIAACEEEFWLEEYNRDENRYSAVKGAHLTLKRAEKARAIVSKIPAMVDTLAAKTTMWEKERGTDFAYDGVRLLSILEEYTSVRKEKELERKRLREQKRLQGQLVPEQETPFGSKPGPLKNVKKVTRTFSGSHRRKPSLGARTDSLHSIISPRLARKVDEEPTISIVSDEQQDINAVED
ncbi:65-kDa microtubule-associated protein 3-like isoform X1 [Typha angustifolia]|uniref:65-kDa microtubule-associated protein 3-like isoform X1 n=1 Tax=Typha angustifolia TaxID=59011 RepID=UPI003C2F7B26